MANSSSNGSGGGTRRSRHRRRAGTSSPAPSPEPRPDATDAGGPSGRRGGRRAQGEATSGDRRLRDLVGAGPSQLGVSGALRGRDADRPTDEGLDSAAAMLRVDHGTMSELALKAPPGSDGLVLVPYLEGERTPNRPDATGALHGLTLRSTMMRMTGALSRLALHRDRLCAIDVHWPGREVRELSAEASHACDRRNVEALPPR